MDNNKIYFKNCINGMQELINEGYSNYFDFIEIDPPYNISKDKWDKFKSHEEYLGFITQVMELTSKLMSKNGTLFLWHNDIEVLSDFIQLIKTNTDLNLKQQCIWNKYYKYNTDGTLYNQYGFLNGYVQLSGNRSYQKMCEYALYYIKEDETGLKTVMCDVNNFQPLRQYAKKLLDDNGLTLKRVNKLLGHRKAEHFFYWNTTQWCMLTEEVYNELTKYINIEKLYSELRYEYDCLRKQYETQVEEYENQRYTFNAEKNKLRSSIWQYPMDKETKHKTEKPMQLYYDMFEVHTKKESRCLFPFVGSGNNIISLLKLNNEDGGNREYIGFETDEKWFNLINERIEEIHKTESIA
jgi:site-specific DNA-methyltransferase (adenine-specific)